MAQRIRFGYPVLVGKKVRVGSLKIKQKCCVSKKRCSSCPVRLLKEGRLPPGYTVHKRKLVTVKKKAKKSAKAKQLREERAKATRTAA